MDAPCCLEEKSLNLDIEPDDIEVEDTVTVVWEILENFAGLRDGCYKTVFRLFAFHSRLEHDKITAYEQSSGGAGWTKSNNTMKLYR